TRQRPGPVSGGSGGRYHRGPGKWAKVFPRSRGKSPGEHWGWGSVDVQAVHLEGLDDRLEERRAAGAAVAAAARGEAVGGGAAVERAAAVAALGADGR